MVVVVVSVSVSMVVVTMVLLCSRVRRRAHHLWCRGTNGNANARVSGELRYQLESPRIRRLATNPIVYNG